MIGFPLAVTFKLSVKKHLFYFIFLFIPLCLSADESFYYFWKLYQNASTFLEKENYLVQAIESWKITDGEENKEIAREHLDFIRYNEGVSLFNNKSYNDALVLFLKISDSYYPYQTAWYAAQCLYYQEKRKEAIGFIENRLKMEYENKAFYSNLYLLLMTYALKENDTAIIENEIDNFIAVTKNENSEQFSWIKYNIVEYYFKKANQEAGREQYDNAIVHYDKAIEICNTGIEPYSNAIVGYLNREDLIIYRGAIDYWREHKDSIQNALSHIYTVFFIKHTDADLINDDSINYHYSFTFSDTDIAEIKNEFDMMQKLVFFLTNGNLYITFKFIELNSTVKKLDMNKSDNDHLFLSPVTDSITPHPGDVYRQEFNQTDSFALIYPFAELPASSEEQLIPGGFSNTELNFIPGIKETKPYRGGLTLCSSYAYSWIFVHEFFHNVEVTYQWEYPVHLWGETKKNDWPPWYNGGGEFTYYQKAFEIIIQGPGLNRMQFSKIKINMEHFYQEYLAMAVPNKDY